MANHHFEVVDVGRSIQAKRLILQRRSYSDDFFIALLPAFAGLFIFCFALWAGVLTGTIMFLALALFAASALAVYSVKGTYGLRQVPAAVSPEASRVAIVETFEAFDCAPYRNNKQYVSGTITTGVFSPLIMVAILDQDHVWLSCRAEMVRGLWGMYRPPFIGGPRCRFAWRFSEHFLNCISALASRQVPAVSGTDSCDSKTDT